MRILLLGGSDLQRLLPMNDAIGAMKQAFEAFSTGTATAPQRLAVPVPSEDAVMLVKPALMPGTGLGAKLVSVFPGNAARGLPVVSGAVLLLDPATGEPIALCDGTVLTAWRTGAASGAATDLLARRNASRAALIGCGAQGRTQALAMDTVRELEVLKIVDRDPRQIEDFAAEMTPKLRARIIDCTRVEDALEDAEIICAATTSSSPVLESAMVADGAHVNGVGSFTPKMRELDPATIARARVVVDSREAALAEAGELIQAVDSGLTDPASWSELGDVVAGSAPGRQGDDELTLFKSVGLAVQDIAAASLAVERAREAGLGTEIELD